MGENSSVVIVYWPHFRIGQSFSFLLFALLNLILYHILSKIRYWMGNLRILLSTETFCFRWTSFSQSKFCRRFYLFLSYTLTSNLSCFPNTLYERRFFFFFFCHFILSFLSIVLTVLKICFRFNIFFEIIQNIILSELKPKHIYARASRIQFFNSPPRPITSKDAFDEWTIISFSYI